MSPVVKKPKKGRCWGLSIDYKSSNVATKKDPYALPFVDGSLDEGEVM